MNGGGNGHCLHNRGSTYKQQKKLTHTAPEKRSGGGGVK